LAPLIPHIVIAARSLQIAKQKQVLCYATHVLTEQEYLRSFGWVPPLPIIAFSGDATIGWKSPLV